MINNYNWTELWESLLRIIRFITSNYLATASNTTPSPNSSGNIPQISISDSTKSPPNSLLSDATQSQLLNILSLSSQVFSFSLLCNNSKKIGRILNMFVTHGELLLTPTSYDQLNYEIIRNQSIISSFFSSCKNQLVEFLSFI